MNKTLRKTKLLSKLSYKRFVALNDSIAAFTLLTSALFSSVDYSMPFHKPRHPINRKGEAEVQIIFKATWALEQWNSDFAKDRQQLRLLTSI